MKTILRHSVLLLVLLIINSREAFSQMQSIICYPQQIDYWTGTTNSSVKTDPSYVRVYTNNQYRGWMMFDVANIPDNATIDSVRLFMTVSSVTSPSPTFQARKLDLDPITSTGNQIYTGIGGSAVIYLTITSTNLTVGTKNYDLPLAKTELKNKLPSDRFVIGFMSTQTGSSRNFQADGQAQTNRPYLKVYFTPQFNDDAGVDSISSPKTLSCEGEYPIIAKIRNFGINTITSLNLSWSLNGVGQTPVSWIGSVDPGGVAYVTLKASHHFNSGLYTIAATTSMPNGNNDPWPNNNTKSATVQILQKPLFVTHPTDQVTTLNGNATFHSIASPVGVAYQWQLSTDAGATFSNLSNAPPYSNVTTNDLIITNASMSMNGYLFRCIASGVCAPPAISDTAMLIVGNPISIKAGPGYGCVSSNCNVPITVKYMNSVVDFKVTVAFNPAIITFANSYINMNPALSGGVMNVSSAGSTLTIQYTSVNPVTLLDGKICDVVFTYLGGTSTLVFDSITPGNCIFHGPGGVVFASDYINSTVSIGTPAYITGTGPFNALTNPGGSVMFYAKFTGLNTYQWEYSSNGGATWSNCTNGTFYQNVTGDTLKVQNILLGMNGYKYRVQVLGCGVPLTSSSATLSVQKNVVIWMDTTNTVCHGNQFIMSVKVKDFDSIGSISLTIWYQPDILWVYVPPNGYYYKNPNLGVVMVNGNVTPPGYPGWRRLIIASYDLDTMSIPDGETMISFKFNFVSDSSILTYESWTPGACQITDVGANTIPTTLIPGFVLDPEPKITTQPTSVTIYAGTNTSFTSNGTGVGALALQWQMSIDGGATWTDVPNSAPYSGVNSPTLTITNAQLSMNGYKYRLRISGLCNPALSDVATLTVNPPPIYIDPGITSGCFGDTILVPINVQNFNNVCNFSMKLVYSSAKLYFDGRQNVHPSLTYQGNLLVNSSGDTIIMSWYSGIPLQSANIGNGVLLKLRFFALTNFTNSPLSWKTTPSGNCEIRDCTTPTPLLKQSVWNNGSVSIYSRPASYLVTNNPASGHFCAGSTGVQIGLFYSQTGVSYALYRDGSVFPPFSGVAGVNAPIVFGTFVVPGTYTVLATNSTSGCTQWMDGFITVVADPPPSVFNVVGGGHYCIGGNGVNVGLSGSATGVEYFLLRNGVETDTSLGSGSTLSFGLQTIAGNYTIKARNAAFQTCLTAMHDTAKVFIDPLPGAAGTITGNPAGPYCQGQNSVAFSVATITDATSYSWTFPAGVNVVSGANTSNVIVNFSNSAASGAQQVTVKGVNNCGDGLSSTLNITINPKPAAAGTITQNPAGSLCQGQTSVTFTVGTILNATSYNWTVPAGYTIVSGNNTNQITVNIATNAIIGPGNVIVYGKNACGDGNSSTLSITTNPLPSPAGNIAGNPAPCQGATGVQYQITPPANTTQYNWQLPTGFTITTNNNNIIIVSVSPTAGPGQIIMTPQNGCGTGIASPPFNVNPQLLPSAAGPISGSIAVCRNTSNVLYNLTAVPSATNYQWTNTMGATGSSTGTTISLNFGLTAVSGQLTVTPKNSCGNGASSTLPVTVYTLPNVSLSPLGTHCLDADPFALSGGSPGGGTYSGTGVTGGTTFNPSLAGVGTYTITYTLTDANTCVNTAQNSITVQTMPKILGNLKYDNVALDIMDNVKIYLKTLANVKLDSSVTAAGTGNYQFRCLNAGTYKLDALCNKAWGGNNATDALLCAQYSVGQVTLTDFRKRAGDVNLSNSVNAGDALLIMRRWTGIVSSFPSGNWIFDDIATNVTVTSSNVTRNLSGLCTGDVNGSYTPPGGKLKPTVTLQTAGIIETSNVETMDIPVRLKENLLAGAITLVLDYPADQLEITGLRTPLKDAVYNIAGEQVRFAWYSLEAVHFAAGEPVLYLRASVKGNMDEAFNPRLEAGPESEFADKSARAYDHVTITIPELKYEGPDPGNTSGRVSDYSLGANHPNPFSHMTTIDYTLPVRSKVRISLFNLLGEEVDVIAEEIRGAGSYKISFDGSNLRPGVYLYKMNAEGETGSFVKTRTMIVKD